MCGLMENIADCLALSDKTIQYMRIQNYHAGLRHMAVLSQKLMGITSEILENAEELQTLGWVVEQEGMVTILSGLMNAQEVADYILLADLLELQLKPYLLQIQEVLVSYIDTTKEQEKLLQKNLQGLGYQYGEIIKLIEADNNSFGGVIEETSSGYKTLCMTDASGTYYYHSNVNPVTEGRAFANQYYSIEQSHYVVFGLGLGYHIKAFCELDDGIYIDIIEPDLQVIKAACCTMELTWLYDNDRVRLIYDPEYTKFQKYLTDDISFIIHYPSFRHVTKDIVRLQLEKYFISDSGKRNFRIQFENNYRDNIANCDGYVDELESEFREKNAIIVAAGPSLDKNIELLRNRPDNVVVVAVGTVFHKMAALGINPDYVIFLDAQPHLYSQIEGLEDMEIPIICATTACKRIARQYKGRKYLICQKGYDRAEEYAKERNYQTYETGGSVSTIALDLCIRLGCKSIAYLGLDLAFTDGHTHASNASDDIAAHEEMNVMVAAVDGGEVPASHLFVMYREWIERRAARASNIKIYDATEGGSLKKGLINITLRELLQKWANNIL